jgi:hypothetical protein
MIDEIRRLHVLTGLYTNYLAGHHEADLIAASAAVLIPLLVFVALDAELDQAVN